MSIFNPKNRHTPGGRIAIALFRVAQAIDYLLRERGYQMGLSPTQIQSLFFLRYARPGVRTIGGLTSRLGVTYPTASGIADTLEQKHLIERIPLPEDRRVITLRLTSEGEKQTETLENLLDEVETAIHALPETDQETVLRALQTIVSRLQKAGYVKVYEMCWGCQFFQPNAHPDHPQGPHHCTFMDAPLPESVTYFECPDFVPANQP